MRQLITSDRLQDLKALVAKGHKINLCNGLGVDSTAVSVLLHSEGIRPDVITFADTGGEKPETLAHRHILNEWYASIGWPQITVCAKVTLPSTSYEDLPAAVREETVTILYDQVGGMIASAILLAAGCTRI